MLHPDDVKTYCLRSLIADVDGSQYSPLLAHMYHLYHHITSTLHRCLRPSRSSLVHLPYQPVRYPRRACTARVRTYSAKRTDISAACSQHLSIHTRPSLSKQRTRRFSTLVSAFAARLSASPSGCYRQFVLRPQRSTGTLGPTRSSDRTSHAYARRCCRSSVVRSPRCCGAAAEVGRTYTDATLRRC